VVKLEGLPGQAPPLAAEAVLGHWAFGKMGTTDQGYPVQREQTHDVLTPAAPDDTIAALMGGATSGLHGAGTGWTACGLDETAAATGTRVGRTRGH
jgi:hypothetical protein